MEISSARLIRAINWATRCATGAREVTHGQEALAARGAAAEAWLTAAVAGTANKAASAAAVTTRPGCPRRRRDRK
jgi:hypothetical protein